MEQAGLAAITGIADSVRILPADATRMRLVVCRPGPGRRTASTILRLDTLRARRVEIADAEDEFEGYFERGWTDGLPVVVPTEARVLSNAHRHHARPG